MEKLTCDFQTCTLKTYLEEKCDFRVSIGYGLGESLQDAVSNSLYALKESMNTVDYNSYLINVKKNKIGLFGDGRLVAFQVTFPSDFESGRRNRVIYPDHSENFKKLRKY